MTSGDINGMSRQYRLRWFDFDRFGHIRPETILDLFQDMATLQAESMGIGFDAMNERGAFWAVTRLRYEVLREPERFQVVTVGTWPHTPQKFSFLRDYDIRDEHDAPLIKATSEWMPLDRASRRFLKIEDIYDGPTDFSPRRCFDAKPKKIKVDDRPPLKTYSAMARFTDIDVNGHVNNSRYPGFVLDALDPKEPLAIQALQIDYRQELLEGSPFIVRLYEDGRDITASAVHDDGTVAFNCRITLRSEVS